MASVPVTDYVCFPYKEPDWGSVPESMNETDTSVLSKMQFEPVEGGTDRACRGADKDDDAYTNKIIWPSSSMRHCKAKCFISTLCTGIEYGNGRCEVWKVAITVSAPMQGYRCLRYVSSEKQVATNTGIVAAIDE